MQGFTGYLRLREGGEDPLNISPYVNGLMVNLIDDGRRDGVYRFLKTNSLDTTEKTAPVKDYEYVPLGE